MAGRSGDRRRDLPRREVPTLAILKDLDVSDATVGDRSTAFAHPDLTSWCRLDELGLVVTGQTLRARPSGPPVSGRRTKRRQGAGNARATGWDGGLATTSLRWVNHLSSEGGNACDPWVKVVSWSVLRRPTLGPEHLTLAPLRDAHREQ